jgi:serine/threonine protein kinase
VSDPDRNPIEELADEFLARQRAGENLSITDYVAEHPDLADDIRELFPTILAMEQLKSHKAASSSGRATLGGKQIERLGDYRILREVGRGGMGIVYEAEQESLSRRVAVKVLPRQVLLEGRQLRRFQREAQTAARLHHTNIVPVFGTGEQDGFHYYVMQFIDGVGLDSVVARLRGEPPRRSNATAALSDQVASALRSGRFVPPEPVSSSSSSTGSAPNVAGPPDLRSAPRSTMPHSDYWQRIARIGLQAASALAYAHEQGTTHRDIKPANLLLDAHGVVWITDFGLAKAVEQDDITLTGDIVGTLQYMAPEQLHGTVDARADIYGLGLTLYELLTLRPAFAAPDRSRMLQLVDSGNPVSPRRLEPGIPGDLETIVLKAIAREPGGRYQTARDMAEDLRRFLDDRPILARRATRVELLWRWCRRNRSTAALAASTIALVLVAGGIGWVAWVMTVSALGREEARGVEARAATTRAETNLALSLEAFEDIFDRVSGPDLFQPIVEDPDAGEAESIASTPISEKDADLLQRILQFYDRFTGQNADNQALLRETARAHRRVGDIHRRLGRFAAAEAAYREALSRYEQVARSGVGPPPSADVALIHNELGRVFATTGRPEQAVAAHTEALRLLENATSAHDRLELARTHNLLGTATRFEGRGPPDGQRPESRPERSGDTGRRGGGRRPPSPDASPSRAHHEQALAIVDQLLEREPGNPEFRLAKAQTIRLLARGLLRGQDRTRAHEMIDTAIEILQGLARDYPDADHHRYELAETYTITESRLRSTSNLEQIIERCDRAREIGVALCAKHPTIPDYRASLAYTLGKLGGALLAKGEEKLAEQHLRDAIRLQQELVEQFPDVPGHAQQLSRSLFSLTTALRDLGELTDLRAVLEASIARIESTLPPDVDERRRGFLLGGPYWMLAQVLDDLGETELAEAARQKAGPGRRRPR